jgi:glutaredoxin
MPIVYSRYNCSACEGVKTYMRENSLPFEEVNIMEDMARGLNLISDGIRTVPVLELEDGERFIGRDAIFEHLKG